MKRTTEESDIIELPPEKVEILKDTADLFNQAHAALAAFERWLKRQMPEGEWAWLDAGDEVFWDDDVLYARGYQPKDLDKGGKNKVVDCTAVVDKYGVLKLVKRTTTVDE